MWIKKWGLVLGFLVIAIVAVVLVVVVTRGADGVAATLDEKDAGTLVELSVGEKVVVHLAGNPTTGYEWEVAGIDPAVIRQEGDHEYESDSDAVGSGGTYTFTFEAVGPGESEVLLIYPGPNPDSPPGAPFSFTVRVG